MADDSHSVRGINWRETFSFTQIFRAFRVAIHPTKLILGLVALLAIYLGGLILDTIWPVSHKAMPDEISLYERFDPSRPFNPDGEAGAAGERGKAYVDFNAYREAQRAEIERQYADFLVKEKIENDKDAAETAKKGGRLGDVKAKVKEERDNRITELQKRAEAERKEAKDDKGRKEVDDKYAIEVRRLYDRAARGYRALGQIKGNGIFATFFEYEVNQINNVAWAVMANDWLGGFGSNPHNRAQPGVLKSITNFCVAGPLWLIRLHTIYFVCFLILFSIAWAVFGGAISRIAAVHVARDEKISMSTALRFSTGKFLSFIFAPIIPLLIVLVVGGIVALGGLLGNIPGVGPILIGLLFFLAIAAGFVMTLVLLGTGGGFNLMYPTIAVEGSDSFDAISRSFSYVYARPWRMLFYTLVAVLYGALCFLFVRFFVNILLILTHYFVGAGMFADIDGSRVPIDLWGAMWPAPGNHGFTYDVDWISLSGPQAIGAFLVKVWVYLTAGMVGAFFISFYFSANTIIYYLMRREVDATELDDVYLEQSEEEFGDTAPAAGGGTTPAATSAPAAPAATAPTVTVVTPATSPDQPTPPPAGG